MYGKEGNFPKRGKPEPENPGKQSRREENLLKPHGQKHKLTTQERKKGSFSEKKGR